VHSSHRFEKLYEYGKQKVKDRRSYSDQNEKDLKELSQCTFSPKIGLKSRQLSKQALIKKSQQEDPSAQVSKLLK